MHVKPKSIRRFDALFPLAALLVLVSSVLSFGALEAEVQLGFNSEGESARGMAIWMVIASLFIFTLLAGILWSTISFMRMGAMRWVLAAVVLLALYQNAVAFIEFGPNLAAFVDLAATLVGGFAVLLLFRPDASAWFAEHPDSPLEP